MIAKKSIGLSGRFLDYILSLDEPGETNVGALSSLMSDIAPRLDDPVDTGGTDGPRIPNVGDPEEVVIQRLKIFMLRRV